MKSQFKVLLTAIAVILLSTIVFGSLVRAAKDKNVDILANKNKSVTIVNGINSISTPTYYKYWFLLKNVETNLDIYCGLALNDQPENIKNLPLIKQYDGHDENINEELDLTPWLVYHQTYINVLRIIGYNTITKYHFSFQVVKRIYNSTTDLQIGNDIILKQREIQKNPASPTTGERNTIDDIVLLAIQPS